MSPKPILAIYTQPGDTEPFESIPTRFSRFEVHIEEDPQAFEQLARQAEIICMARKYKRSTVVQAHRLKWLHVGGTGIDRLHPLDELNADLIITNTPALNASMMADYAICVMLMLTWDFPRILRNQVARIWERWPVDRVEGKTIAVIGIGGIGRSIAEKASALGMKVVGVKRSPEAVPGIERVVGVGKLQRVLGEADYVILAVPLTPQTLEMIGPAELRSMKHTAFLINVSRGKVVQQRALIEALKQGWIAAAALDVFEQEPLPPDSELWGLENVILTPHVSSLSTDYREHAAVVFIENLQRYVSGRPLLNRIDRAKGY